MSKIILKKLIIESLKKTGGLSDGMTVEDIAKKHKVDVSVVRKQLELGKKVEMEHTKDQKVAEKIAMDHIFERPDYYSMLRKAEKTPVAVVESFRMFLESTLENMQIEDGDDEANIELLHEIEYKLSKITANRWSLHPKLFKNIVVRFSTLALSIYEIYIQKYNDLFIYWKEIHRIDSAESFADMIADEMVEMYGDDWENSEVNQHGISRGKDITITKRDVADTITQESILNRLHEYNDSGDDVVEIFQWATSGFLESIPVKIPVKYADDPEEFAKTYINKKNLIGDFMSYLSDNYSVDDLFGDFNLTKEDWLNTVKTNMYPQYMDRFGVDVENVIDEINEHFNREANVNVARIEKLIDAVRTVSVDSSEFDDVVKELYENGVATMLRIISLAMNIDHVHGNISTDYGDYADLVVSKSFYDKMHNRGVQDWDSELKTLIKK